VLVRALRLRLHFEHVNQPPEFSSFGRYSTEALRVLFAARHSLARLGGEALLPEHILLALLEPASGSAFAALHEIGVPIESVRKELEGRLQGLPAVTQVGDVPLSEGAKAVLENALAVTADQIGSQHLVSGLLLEGKSEAAALLRAHGVTVERLG
jgi:ATP-dependent Clp protease ATP-binding subunit ClpA